MGFSQKPSKQLTVFKLYFLWKPVNIKKSANVTGKH